MDYNQKNPQQGNPKKPSQDKEGMGHKTGQDKQKPNQGQNFKR